MAQMDVLSTAGLTAQHRIEYWNGVAENSATPSTWEARDQPRFSGQLTRTQIDDLAVADVCVSPSIVRHSRAHVAKTGRPVFSLKMQLDGSSVTRQDGREARLTPGDFTLCDSTRPYELECDVVNRMLVLGIPAPLLRGHVACPERLTAIPMSGADGMSGLLSGFLRNLWSRFPNGADPVAAPHVTHAVLNLIASAYAVVPTTRLARPPMSTVHRVRIRNFVEKHLSNPELTPSYIAEACNIKSRYLRKLFTGSEETLARYILRRRLEECARTLALESHRSRTVTEIAFAYGFNSPTHFGRVFRERYGVTPSEYRARVSKV
jgi:AraC family transcriptional activator of tynA and feaB